MAWLSYVLAKYPDGFHKYVTMYTCIQKMYVEFELLFFSLLVQKNKFLFNIFIF